MAVSNNEILTRAANFAPFMHITPILLDFNERLYRADSERQGLFTRVGSLEAGLSSVNIRLSELTQITADLIERIVALETSQGLALQDARIRAVRLM